MKQRRLCRLIIELQLNKILINVTEKHAMQKVAVQQTRVCGSVLLCARGGDCADVV